MKKVIAAINMTLDGFCDHTSGVSDEEIHQHYADLLRSADTALFGNYYYITYYQKIFKINAL